MNNRKPIYDRERKHRIVSIDGDRWVLQGHCGSKSARDFDPWINERRPSDFHTALSHLRAYEPNLQI